MADRLAARPHIPRLVVFNHKGGVGKTTLTVNIAAALADRGKRILLVDADPQCNLTSYLIEDKVVDDLLDESDTKSGRTLWSAMKPIVEATGDPKDIRPIERFERVYVLPGDIRLSEFESELTELWAQSFQRKVRGFRGTAALSALIGHIADRLKIDYVFYDAGPNIGPLNRVILLDCDYFIVPVAADLFSVRALKTLGRTLVQWIRDWETIAALAPEDTYLLRGRPRFLGYIPQGFRIYGGRPTVQHSRYLARMDRHINSDVIAVLRSVDPSLVVAGSKLGEVKDFASLVPASHREGLPFADVPTGAADQKAAARAAFRLIAKRILDRTRGSAS